MISVQIQTRIAVLCLLVSAVTLPAMPQNSNNSINSDSWLHPNETAYLAAIDDGFSGRAKIGPYNEDKDGIHQIWIQFNTTGGDFNKLIFFSPLRCAQLLGINARQKLLDAPSVQETKRTCDGFLFLNVQYATKYEATDFPIVVQHDTTVLRAPSTTFTSIPGIIESWSGFSYVPIYEYSAVFHFRPPEAWSDGISIRYVVPEKGDPVTAPLDLSKFVGDEDAYRLLGRASTF